jgi:Cu/Ag efflux protein CusF
MPMRSMLLAAALVATAAVAQEKPKPPENSNQPPTADSQKADPDAPKSYGYGEQPGDEAGKDSAGQSSDPSRAKSKMPQDQRADSGKAGEKGKDTSVLGQVVTVSPESVSVRGEDKEVQTLAVDEKTVVLREGQRLELSRLQPGDEVRAAVEQRGNQTVATRITVEPGDPAMQQGTGGKESVDTPGHTREGMGGHIENTHPDPEPDQGGAQPTPTPTGGK